MSYAAPVRDLAFALLETAGGRALIGSEAFADFDGDTAQAILEAAGQVSAELLAPLNRVGDRHGATYANGAVTAAPGFAKAYRAFAAGGWTSLSAEAAHGGQGLPKALELAVFETVHAANMAFGLCPLLTQGAAEAVAAYGDARQQRLYLEKMVSGAWTGTMNLTEPQAGSDLSTVATRAEPDGEGGYRLTGQKIYITWGDHDAADNIVHLVLARLPDAPAGTRGISLFLCPKTLVGEDGSLGARNAVRPVGIEHKLGIHASPTCTMQFDGAYGELVGREHNGLPQMFTMMNAARLNVGCEGVGIAERAYQQALAYARERRQGRGGFDGEANAAIFDQPDVRRTLLLMKAKVEAGRALVLATGVQLDLARAAATEAEQEAARLRAELFVPVAKAWCTDMGCEVASLGVQVHGGMGFVEETGAAQHYRDARIGPIYEGTNGIQAMDLVGRKLTSGGGEPWRALLADVRETAQALIALPDMAAAADHLMTAADDAEHAAGWLVERKGTADALAGATPFLALLGDLLGGWLLSRGALAAARLAKAPDADAGWLAGKAQLCRFYAEAVLAQGGGKTYAVTAGAALLDAGALG